MRACIDKLGDRSRTRELIDWRIYRAGIERGRELERDAFARGGA